jgi:predicted ATPase/DNA-binding winged helix-turn-helix (wHTH) protein
MSIANEPHAAPGNEHAISFDSFRLFPGQRLLLDADRPVRLGSRALDILTVLVEHAGRVVSKEELIARVWPNVFVEESNLKIQVSALRRAMGDGQVGARYIVTVPGRGYEFVAPVSRTEEVRAPPVVTTARTHNLPVAVTRMIGRDETLAALVSRLSRERLVTIVGPGGIGKTTLALAVAEAMLPAYEHGVWFIDLAPLTDPSRVASTVAAALDLETHAADSLPGLVARLSDNRMLLVLDNCEHVIEAAAELATSLLRSIPGISILATSREPLEVAGGRDYRLRPLAMPSPSPALAAADALSFPAVQLFLERVSTVIEDFALTDTDAPFVVEICRRLDGVPLAIELAAARVEVLGIKGLATHLDNSLQLLRARQRTTMPRHQTIRAVLDWSYDLLSRDEKLLFRRIGVFASTFDLKAATGIASHTDLLPGDVVERLSDLVAKSLVTVYLDTPVPRFRLVETTRAYALEKLAASGERERLLRRGAEYARDRLERAQPTLEARPTADRLVSYGYWIDNIRLVLDWAFSPEGDASVGVALTAAAVPLWMHLALVEECRVWVGQALAAHAGTASPDERLEMRLRAAQGALLIIARGAAAPDSGAAWTRALAIAERLDDTEYQLRGLWGLWLFHVNSGRYRIPLELAERFHRLAATRPGSGDPLLGRRMTGVSAYLQGDLAGARDNLERVLAEYVASDDRSHTIRFQFDLPVSARVFIAWILWLQGLPDQAIRAAETAVEDARAANHAISLCYALTLGACPIAFMTGNLTAAEHYVSTLVEQSTRHALTLWGALGRAYGGLLLLRRGDLTAGSAALRTGLDEAGAAGLAVRLISFLDLSSEPSRHAGQIASQLKAVEEAIDRSTAVEEHWAIAELLRIRGELLLSEGAHGVAIMAEDHFRQALDWARRQGALSWELRTATSLARLLRDQARSAEAVSLLESVYDRFMQGFETADLIAARRLLDELNDVGHQ